MTKKICDNCKKEPKKAYVNVSIVGVTDLMFDHFDVCEKCIDVIPKLIKETQKPKSSS
jgi:hypothetical protein